MPLDVSRSDLSLAVIGAGVMGRGIAQVAAQAGIRVLLHDSRTGAAREAKAAVSAQLDRLREKGRLTAAECERATANLVIADTLSGVAACPVVIEAVVEDLKAKRELFAALEAFVAPDSLLASNTSSFSIAALAARFGHRAVRAKDTPGFIVNHAGRGYGTEALRILGEGIAEFHEIDRILRDLAGFRLGPFELLDLTGLDVSHPVMESIYRQYYDEPRYRPSPITGQRVNAGLFGRKSGRGFYGHAGGKQEEIAEAPAPNARPESVWVSPSELGGRLVELLRPLGAHLDRGARPAAQSLCLVAPLGYDATTAALEEELDPARTVAVDCLFPADDVPVTVIRDSPGFVAQRVVAQIVNIACDIAQQRIASPADIDAAVTLGLGYPRGPLAWGDALGPARILGI